MKADVILATKNSNIELMLVDLSLQELIRQMATTFKEKYERLDVLINNAAIYKSHREMTSEGLELMFATNHVGPFLLTNLLLDKLKTVYLPVYWLLPLPLPLPLILITFKARSDLAL